jgi:vitamin B12 transporter
MTIAKYVVCSALPIVFAGAAAAQPIETVLITASSLAPVSLQQSGSAVSVITGDLIEQRQIETVFDVLREVPGVAVSRTGTLGSLSQIRIRGAESNHTLVLIDGVEANDPASLSEFNFAHLLSPGIERIEVLRGPQSALWGADAVAGVVNVLTVAPRPGLFARGSAEGGSFATRQVTLLGNAGNETMGAVVDGAYLKTAGINIARTGSEKDGYENLTLGARAFFEPAPQLALSGAFRHINGNSDFDNGFPYPDDTDDYTQAAQDYGRAQAKLTLLGGALDATAGYGLTRTRTDNLSAGLLNDGIRGEKDRFDLLANGTWSGMFGHAMLRQRVSVLGETADERFEQRFVNLSIADQKQSLTESGIAAEYWAAFDERIFLSLGARQDWNDRSADATTWRVTGSALLPNSAVRLHASAGTGVKNPDFYELYGFVPLSFVGNPDLKPERSLGFDGGVEVTLFGERLLADATYFHADLEHEIFTDFAVFPSTARNASGESTRQGVELAAKALLADGLTLSGAYTYTESEEEGGAEELRRPHHVASLNLDYRFLMDRAALNFGADIHGAQRDTDFATFAQVTLPAYTLVRAAASYEVAPHWQLTARIENALDEDYEEVVGYRTRGFGIFAGLRAAIGE